MGTTHSVEVGLVIRNEGEDREGIVASAVDGVNGVLSNIRAGKSVKAPNPVYQ